MNNLLNTILKDTFSTNLLKHRLRILKTNLLKTFFGSQTEELFLSAEDMNWLKSIPLPLYQQFNKDNVYQIFSNLETEISKLKILTIYLTFEPDEITLGQIGAFARKTFDPALLLDIKLNPNLIAGTAFVWKGIYKDYSLHAKIEEKKPEILEGFKKFLR
ncbi:MAG: hypothetical protein Q8Q91_02375 [Candidatus Daviesbacteria bacterium]|nr:hypothetical protein [Candidatus Daviesbacteria bacterium]